MTTPTADTSSTARSVPAKTDFPIFATIKLGTGLKTAVDFVTALEAAGFKLNYWIEKMLTHPSFQVSDDCVEIDLVVVSHEDLGLDMKTSTRETIYERALSLGLELCPLEACPQHRLQDTRDAFMEFRIFATEPIVFVIGHNEVVFFPEDSSTGKWLYPADALSKSVTWTLPHQYIFVKPRK